MIRCSRSTTLRSAGESPNRPRRLADMLLAELDAIVSLAAVPRSQARMYIPTRRCPRGSARRGHSPSRSRRSAGPDRACEIGHHVRDLKAIDRDDVVARSNARGLGRGSDRESELASGRPRRARCLRGCRRSGQNSARPDRNDTRCPRADRRWRAEAPGSRSAGRGPARVARGRECGPAGAAAGKRESLDAHCGIRRHDSVMPPCAPQCSN